MRAEPDGEGAAALMTQPAARRLAGGNEGRQPPSPLLPLPQQRTSALTLGSRRPAVPWGRRAAGLDPRAPASRPDPPHGNRRAAI